MTDLPENEKKELIEEIRRIARMAGDITLRHFQDGVDVMRKKDRSPVTKADREAEELILSEMKNINIPYPIIAEEAVAAGDIPDISDTDHFWLVDPLDGTREFISGRGEYTVNIALVKRTGPVLGVVYTPVKDYLYSGWGAGTATLSAEKGPHKPIRTRPFPDIGLTVISSRSHGDTNRIENFLGERTIAEHMTRGSSLKFCQIAKGRADIYPRFGPTYEWDIAAGDAVLRAAGGGIYTVTGRPMTYGKERFWNAEFVATASDAVF